MNKVFLAFCLIWISAAASFAGETGSGGAEATAAGRQLFSVGPKGVYLFIAPGWQAEEASFGMDLMVTGPETDGERPVVTVNFLGESPAIEIKDQKSEEGEYRAGREEWLARKGGKFLALIPLRNISLAGAAGVTVGCRYTLEGKEYLENTWYVVCNGNAYNLKTLIPRGSEAGSSPVADRIVSGFSCL
jgi:hypothetical protein